MCTRIWSCASEFAPEQRSGKDNFISIIVNQLHLHVQFTRNRERLSGVKKQHNIQYTCGVTDSYCVTGKRLNSANNY